METDSMVNSFTCELLFKSYYVVWKQASLKLNDIYLAWFKSYYVVWKLDPPASEDIDTMCLNRTM